jgi:hypothetical protein
MWLDARLCYFDSPSLRITAYLRLVVLAAAFQHGLKRGLSRRSEVFVKAFDAAKMVISIMVERLYPTSHLRYAMEANFLYVAYAAAFLTNVGDTFHSFFFLQKEEPLLTYSPPVVASHTPSASG